MNYALLDKQTGTKYEIPNKGIVNIGRASDNQIVIPNIMSAMEVGKYHCQLKRTNGSLFISHGSSFNGTYVDEIKLETSKNTLEPDLIMLKLGQIIGLGYNYKLEVICGNGDQKIKVG
jgi:pSer/pThr/pTyr-binding forkhead associated (FHA) protein